MESPKRGASPWASLADLAESSLEDESGLRPWWILKGADIRSIVLAVPTSEQLAKLEWLKEQVLLYRLALGHPNQEDFVEFLSRSRSVDRDVVQRSSLELSAYFSQGGVDRE